MKSDLALPCPTLCHERFMKGNRPANESVTWDMAISLWRNAELEAVDSCQTIVPVFVLAPSQSTACPRCRTTSAGTWVHFQSTSIATYNGAYGVRPWRIPAVTIVWTSVFSQVGVPEIIKVEGFPTNLASYYIVLTLDLPVLFG